MMDRKTERILEMAQALKPFAEEAEKWDGFDDGEKLVEGAPGFPDSGLTVGHLRVAREALLD